MCLAKTFCVSCWRLAELALFWLLNWLRVARHQTLIGVAHVVGQMASCWLPLYVKMLHFAMVSTLIINDWGRYTAQAWQKLLEEGRLKEPRCLGRN